MKRHFLILSSLWLCAVSAANDAAAQAAPEDSAPTRLEQVQYNHSALVVDAGVGLWAHPLPMDYDGDGDNDLVAATPDVPSNGVYFFENKSGETFPVFAPPVRLGTAMRNITVSYPDGGPVVMSPGKVYPDFRNTVWDGGEVIRFKPRVDVERPRARQWKRCDYDGDGVHDLVIGMGEWADYGWDNAYNEQGEWTRGPLHGYVYVARNTGTNEAPEYAEAEQVMTEDGPVDVFGAPSPNFRDWDGDGDLDLICGSFLDDITYFENTGSRTKPKYAAGRPLTHQGEALEMELQMLQIVAFDWDQDGDSDLVVGQEDGRVAWLEFTGTMTGGVPAFAPPRFFKQEAAALKVGALCTPASGDWDGDGDEDLIVGDTAGFISVVENLDGGNPPKWAAPVRLEAGGETIRIQAGENGSIQGPAEAKWGYTVPDVADWNHDGLLDIVINNIWGKVLWYENTGTREAPNLKPAQYVRVAWDGKPIKPPWNWWEPKPDQLVTQWRTSPMIRDLNSDGLNDLIILDHEGYLAFFERTRRDGELVLLPGQRIFKDAEGHPLQLKEGTAGKSGRRKLALADWDGDGKLDLLANSTNIDFWRNVADGPGEYRFKNEGPVDPRRLAGHTTCPAIVDWNTDGTPDLLIGAEDGFLYYLENDAGD